MPIDSGEIDTAVLNHLASDATLMAFVPDGIWFDEGPANGKRFVILSVFDTIDDRRFEGRSHETVIYMIKAVILTTTPNATATARQAAARIDALLDPQPPDPPATIVAPGYSIMASYREPAIPRVRHTEVDDVDPTIRFLHRGGHYRVVMST
jgi:hypothetical protein